MRTAEFIERCTNAGMPLKVALEAAKAFDAEVAICIELTLADRREKDRARQAKHRAKDGHVTNVTSRDSHVVTLSDVTERDRPRDARVRDITSTSENIIISSAASEREELSEIDWPEGDKPSRAYCEELEAALRQAAGASINAAAPMLHTVSPILALSRAGKGPPCDLQADVLPAIRACAAKTSPGHAERWDYFVPAIRQARDRRLAGAPEVGAVVPLRATGPPRSFNEQATTAWDEATKRILADG